MTAAFFSVHPTPIGEALLIVTDEGLATLAVLDGPVEAALAGEALRLRTVPVHDPAATRAITDQLDAYFAGERDVFDVTIDWGDITGFVRTALETIREVPYGQTASYAEVAILAGSPGANRAVGSACARTPISIIVPAHRIVRSDGSLGEYGGHPERKRHLLDLESAHASTPDAGV